MAIGSDFKIDVILNPLRFFQADFYLLGQGGLPSSEEILRQLCSVSLKSDPLSFVERYKDFKQAGNQTLNLAPPDKEILEKMVFPIQHAKNSYLLGNYIGAASLCGMVAEMVAIFLYKISNIKFNNKPIDQGTKKKFYGSEFEKLGQERRVGILHAFGIIDDQVKQHFDTIRTNRRRYMHFFSQEHSKIKNDSLKCIESIEYLMMHLMNPRIDNGKVRFNPDLMNYLMQQGIVRKAD